MEGKVKRCSETSNIAHILQSREIGNKLASGYAHSQMKFRNFQLQGEFDICYQIRNQTSKIVQIVTAGSIIFALALSGLCTAFDRETNKRLCHLYSSPHEQIRRLFYNKLNNSLITISSDRFSRQCRTTPLESIRMAQLAPGFALFEGQMPVQFDVTHGKALTFSTQDDIYNVFDLKNYTLLYSIFDKEIEEIKITPGIMLLILKRSACGRILPLKILSVEDGTVLKSMNHALLPNKRIDFLELFHEKMLVKQENECLQMVDLQNEKIVELSKREFKEPSEFFFMYGKRLFLAFQSRTVFVWNLQGELVASYRDHLNRDPRCDFQLTQDSKMLIYYDKRNGLIKISDTLTGNCYAKIGGNDPNVGISCRNQSNATLIQSTVQDALADTTALSYDEERNEIYTGNTRGFVYVWSN